MYRGLKTGQVYTLTLHKNFIKKMKQPELIEINLNLNPDSGIHHKWFPVFIFFRLKFLPFKKAMKPSSSSLSRFCSRRLKLQPCCLEYESFLIFATLGYSVGIKKSNPFINPLICILKAL